MSLNEMFEEDKGELSSEQLAPEGLHKPPVSPASNVNLAAHGAVLSEDVAGGFHTMASELDESGHSETMEELLQGAKKASMESSEDALTQMLLDPSVSQVDKESAIFGFSQLAASPTSVQDVVSEQALQAPSKGETVQAEVSRISTAALVSQINDYKRDKTAILNAAAATGGHNTSELVVDLAELITPFVESKFVSDVLADLRGKRSMKDVVLSGSAKAELKATIAKMPLDMQLEATQKLVEVINSNSSIVLPGANDIARLDLLRTVLEDGYYTDADKYLDNIVSVLDLTILGGVLSAPAKIVGRISRLITGKSPSVTDTVADGVRSGVTPSSVSENLKDTNPAKSKDMHNAADEDLSGSVAEAGYGTTRTEAMANDTLGEVAKADGSVKNKTGNAGSQADQVSTGNPETLEFSKRDGQIQYWQQEKRSARAHIANDFHNATGLTARSELDTVEDVNGSARYSIKYGPEQGGWANAEDALESVKVGLRDVGVTEDNLTLLVRDGDSYVPTKLDELTDQVGDYLVQVNYDYKVNPMDVDEWAKPDVKWNLFDRSSLLSGASNGSFQRHLLDSASMLHPKITLGAMHVVDKTAELDRKLTVDLKKFSDTYIKLPSDRQQLLEGIIKKANFESQGPNLNTLAGEGFSAKEIGALSAWKDYGDTMYWLENADVVKTLSNQGYRILETGETGASLFAKPMHKNAVSQARAYDPVADEMVTLSRADIDSLYEAGGELGNLKQATVIDDEMVELIVTQNKPGSYLRKLNPEDKALNYRPWHYQVQYKAPYFIDELVHNSKGEFLYKKAVAMSDNIKDAERQVRQMSSTSGKKYAAPRRDVRVLDTSSDDYWSLQVTSGRTSQKVRGKRLEDSTNPVNTGADNQFVMGPIDSAILASRNMAKRASTRDYLDATKARFMDSYSDLIPKGKFGQIVFPRQSKDISNMGAVGKGDSKRLADARTTFEYIKSVEVGYINSIDDGFKALLRGVGDIAGSSGLGKLEKGANLMADNISVTNDLKQLATMLYITTNPLRQITVQSSQALQLTSNFPKYVLSQGLARDMSWLYPVMSANGELNKISKTLIKAAGRTETEAKSMYKAFIESGLASGIDRQSLIKGSLTDMVESSKITGNKSVLAKPLGIARKYGFDAGETVNISTSWLAHYDKMSKAKKGRLTQADLDKVAAGARNYTGGFNDAGRMPYSENFLGLIFHYVQVPHKLILTGLTNRAMSVPERIRMTSFNALMFSLPPAAMYSMFGEILPDDEDARDLVVQGLLGYTFSTMLTQASQMVDESQPKTRLDFANIAPNDFTGLIELVHGLMTTDAGEILAGTPASQLFFGNNPRLTNFAKDVSRLFHYFDDEKEPIAVAALAKESSKMFSGMSNLWKSKLALETGKKFNSLGAPTDIEVSAFEGMAQAFGIPTMDEAQRRWIGNNLYEKSQVFRDDVKEFYKVVKRELTVDGLDAQSMERVSKVIGYANQAFEGESKVAALTIISNLLAKDAKKGDGSLYLSILKSHGMLGGKETHKMFDAVPDWDEKKRQKAHDTIDFASGFKIETTGE